MAANLAASAAGPAVGSLVVATQRMQDLGDKLHVLRKSAVKKAWISAIEAMTWTVDTYNKQTAEIEAKGDEFVTIPGFKVRNDQKGAQYDCVMSWRGNNAGETLFTFDAPILINWNKMSVFIQFFMAILGFFYADGTFDDEQNKKKVKKELRDAWAEISSRPSPKTSSSTGIETDPNPPNPPKPPVVTTTRNTNSNPRPPPPPLPAKQSEPTQPPSKPFDDGAVKGTVQNVTPGVAAPSARYVNKEIGVDKLYPLLNKVANLVSYENNERTAHSPQHPKQQQRGGDGSQRSQRSLSWLRRSSSTGKLTLKVTPEKYHEFIGIFYYITNIFTNVRIVSQLLSVRYVELFRRAKGTPLEKQFLQRVNHELGISSIDDVLGLFEHMLVIDYSEWADTLVSHVQKTPALVRQGEIIKALHDDQGTNKRCLLADLLFVLYDDPSPPVDMMETLIDHFESYVKKLNAFIVLCYALDRMFSQGNALEHAYTELDDPVQVYLRIRVDNNAATKRYEMKSSKGGEVLLNFKSDSVVNNDPYTKFWNAYIRDTDFKDGFKNFTIGAARKSALDSPFVYSFGPFKKVYDRPSGNNDIAVDFTPDLASKLKAGKSVIIIAYGPSGAGKTSTLVYFQKQQESGILMGGVMEALKTFGELKITVSEFYVDHDQRVAADLQNQKMIPTKDRTATYKSTSAQQEISRFIAESLSDEKNRRIAGTPNNPVSSRSHVVVDLHFTRPGGPDAHMFICDFAGVEERFDCQDPVVLANFLHTLENGDNDLSKNWYKNPAKAPTRLATLTRAPGGNDGQERFLSCWTNQGDTVKRAEQVNIPELRVKTFKERARLLQRGGAASGPNVNIDELERQMNDLAQNPPNIPLEPAEKLSMYTINGGLLEAPLQDHAPAELGEYISRTFNMVTGKANEAIGQNVPDVAISAFYGTQFPCLLFTSPNSTPAQASDLSVPINSTFSYTGKDWNRTTIDAWRVRMSDATVALPQVDFAKIVDPYHRKRTLEFAESLQSKMDSKTSREDLGADYDTYYEQFANFEREAFNLAELFFGFRDDVVQARISVEIRGGKSTKGRIAVTKGLHYDDTAFRYNVPVDKDDSNAMQAFRILKSVLKGIVRVLDSEDFDRHLEANKKNGQKPPPSVALFRSYVNHHAENQRRFVYVTKNVTKPVTKPVTKNDKTDKTEANVTLLPRTIYGMIQDSGNRTGLVVVNHVGTGGGFRVMSPNYSIMGFNVNENYGIPDGSLYKMVDFLLTRRRGGALLIESCFLAHVDTFRRRRFTLRKILKPVCECRAVEGAFINKTLANINITLKRLMDIKIAKRRTLRDVPLVNTPGCNAQLCDSFNGCYDEAINRSPDVDKVLQTAIFDVLDENNNGDLSRVADKLDVIVFGVMNFSRYVDPITNLEKPVRTPYVSTAFLRSEVIRLERRNKELNHLMTPELKDVLNPTRELASLDPAEGGPITSEGRALVDYRVVKMFQAWAEYEKPRYSKGDWRTLTQKIDAVLKDRSDSSYLNSALRDLIDFQDKLNAASPIGALEYLDSIAKWGRAVAPCTMSPFWGQFNRHYGKYIQKSSIWSPQAII